MKSREKKWIKKIDWNNDFITQFHANKNSHDFGYCQK